MNDGHVAPVGTGGIGPSTVLGWRLASGFDDPKPAGSSLVPDQFARARWAQCLEMLDLHGGVSMGFLSYPPKIGCRPYRPQNLRTCKEFGLPTYREPLVTSACFKDTWAWVLPLVKKISRSWRSVGTSKLRTWRWRFRVVTRPNRLKTWVKSWNPRCHPNGKREKASSRNTQGTSTVAWQLLHVAAYFGHEDAVKAQKGKGRRPVITWWLKPHNECQAEHWFSGSSLNSYLATWYLSSFAVWILQKAWNTGMLPVQEWVTTSNPQMIWWYSCHSICIHAKLPATRNYTFTKMRRHGTDGWPVKRKAEENPVR